VGADQHPDVTAGVTAPAPVTAADLAGFADISAVTLSADGRIVAAVVSVPDVQANRYRRAVVTGPADASAAGAGSGLRPLSPGSAPEMLPAWSPAGYDLATVRHDDGGWSIWRSRLSADAAATGPADALVTGWPDPIEELCWSPSGDRLLFVAREPADRRWFETPEDRRPPLRITTLRYREDGIGWTVNRPRQAYVVPVTAGSRPRKISRGGYDDAEFGWHPDGRRVVFVSQRQSGADHTIVNDVFTLDADGEGEATRLTGTTFACAQPRVSPDGELVAFTATDVPRFPAVAELAVVPMTGGPVTILSGGLDRDCNGPSTGMAGPVWAGGQLTVLAESEGAISAFRFDPAAPGRQQLVVGGERRIASLAQAGTTLVYVSSAPALPPRLVTLASDGDERVLLDPSAALAAARDLRRPVRRRVRAGDGTTIDSWLTMPDPRRWTAPFPLLLCLQGGGSQYGYQWSQEFQALASAGFATLQVNPRGSAGYGTAWMRTVSGPAAATPGTGWGTVDISDVLAVVRDTLAAEAGLDPSRVGVQGGSYGGLVTTWLLAESDVFAAGWAERGPYNLVSLAGTNDESPWFFEAYLGRSVTEDPAAYWSSSTLRLASRITAPLAIMHSEDDRRCPIQQAEELFMALKLHGREVEFIRFPGESHGLSRTGTPVHRLQRLELLIEWFTRWLRPEPATEGAA
jgi:dipeptidyl aminopeptidase/acylaminoacyl peptidase